MMQGAAENTSRFHNQALANPDTAEAFVTKEWQAAAVNDRYDWLFSYDAESVEI